MNEHSYCKDVEEFGPKTLDCGTNTLNAVALKVQTSFHLSFHLVYFLLTLQKYFGQQHTSEELFF